MRRAFTLVETLVCIGIICLVAGITAVLIQPARHAAAVVKTKSNLHQIQLATALYQSEYDGDGKYGNTYAMGLPVGYPYTTLPILSQIRPPLAWSKKGSSVGISYWVYYNDPNKDGLVPTWENYTKSEEGKAVLYSDPFNNDASLPLDGAPLVRRRVIGVTVDGTILDRRRPGDWMMRTWWQ